MGSRRTLIALLTLLLLGVSVSLQAQTQTVVIAPQLAPCGISMPANPAALEPAEAEALVKAASKSFDTLKHYVLHVVRFNAAAGIEQEAWYAFHERKLDPTRLFGAPQATLVIGLAGGKIPPLPDLAYTVTITKKRAAPLQNLMDLGKFALMGKAPALAAPPNSCAAATFNVNWRPSDMKFAATTTVNEEQKELSSMTFDNERKYAVDVSLALPLKSHNDLSFDVDQGVATAKSVKKTDLFAVVNLGVPRDTKRMTFVWPTLLYGMPITGKPLKKQLIALGFGYSKVQLFAGGLFTRREVGQATVGNGEVSLEVRSDENDKWDSAFVWGVNLSVKFVTDLLKDKS